MITNSKEKKGHALLSPAKPDAFQFKPAPVPVHAATGEPEDGLMPVTYTPDFFIRLIHPSNKMDQEKFGDSGACGTLCNLFLLQRMRGVKPADIVESFRQPAMIETILRSHARAGRECRGAWLEGMVNIALQISLTTLQFKSYQRGTVPELRAIGQYPANFQRVLGEKPTETDDEVWPLLPAPRSPDLSLRLSLLAGLNDTKGCTPLVYIQLRKNAECGSFGHAMALDLGNDFPGLFDPNFGFMSLRQGFNNIVLARLFQSVFEEYKEEADGCIAYQLRPGSISCAPPSKYDPDELDDDFDQDKFIW